MNELDDLESGERKRALCLADLASRDFAAEDRTRHMNDMGTA